MKKPVFVFCVLLIGTILFCEFQPASAGMSSASYRISTDVLSSGSNVMTSASYEMNAIVGQDGVINVSEGSNYISSAGFWHMLLIEILGGDVNGDGTVDIIDAVLTLQLLAGRAAPETFINADINNDYRTGLPEALYIMGIISGARKVQSKE